MAITLGVLILHAINNEQTLILESLPVPVPIKTQERGGVGKWGCSSRGAYNTIHVSIIIIQLHFVLCKEAYKYHTIFVLQRTVKTDILVMPKQGIGSKL